MAMVAALGSVATTLLGGLVAARIRRFRPLVFGLAAGLMLGVVGFDLLPEALRQSPQIVYGVPGPLLAFVLGFLVLHGVESTIGTHDVQGDRYGGDPHREQVGLVAASALIGHSVMDGFAIGAGFQAGHTVGVAVSIAVVAHDFADGFNTFTIAAAYGNSDRRSVALVALDALAPLVGAASTLLIQIPGHILGLYLGSFAGLLLYLAAADILPQAHTDRSPLPAMASTITGLLAMWFVIGYLA
ncbi:MAG: ZIP family metal transporter [Acidimicrobiales bacterium]